MFSRLLTAAAVLGALASHSLAQTFTGCDPLNGTCPADPALGTTYNSTFTSSMTELDTHVWNVTAGASLIGFGDNGTSMTIRELGDSVTAQSTFYIFWGTVEIIMKVASGTGIISTVNLLSDDLDEIDWEIMGGNTTHVETNYYGHGNLSQRFATYYPCDGPQERFHNYTINWQKDKTEWILDGDVVRTVPYGPSGIYPQTPSFIKMGVWAAGASTEPEGTRQWAGGDTDFSQSPFTMYVKSIRITDGSTNTTAYSYGDTSGSWESIKATTGVSKVNQHVNEGPSTSEKAMSKFSSLSTAAKASIAAVAVVLLVVVLGVWSFCWRRQRKIGRDERRAAEEKFRAEQDSQHAYQMAYQQQMKSGAFARYSQQY